MAGFDGNGNYVRPYNWTNDAANGLPIDAGKFDTDGNDVATAFGICLTRDNQGKPSAPLTWAQTLALTQGVDGMVLSFGRTGGSNNPVGTFDVTDATGIDLTTSFGNISLITPQGTFTLLTTGGIQLAQPASGAAFTLNSVSAGTAINGSDGVVHWQVNTNAGALQLGTSNNTGASFFTNNLTRLSLAATGITVAQPSSSGYAISVTGFSGVAPFNLINGGAAAPFAAFDTNYISTGSATPVLTANKPTGGGTAIQQWLKVTVNGATGYIPVWQ